MEKIFRDVAGDDMEIDWMELKRILDQTMRDGKCLSLNLFCFHLKLLVEKITYRTWTASKEQLFIKCNAWWLR